MSRKHTSQSSATHLPRWANGILSGAPLLFRMAFGRSVGPIDAIFLITDGDQTAALVEGWYGDITHQAQ